MTEQITPAPNTDIPAPGTSLVLYEEAQEIEQAEESEFHPLSMPFPLMSDEKLRALADDIKAKSQLEPIILYEDKILDGRNRYRACPLAGVEPRFEQYVGNDPVGYVTSKNAKRTHLTISQRAMSAAKLANLKHGGKRQDANLRLAISRSQAAEMMDVSETYVSYAKRVLDEGPSDLAEAVWRGEKTLSKAMSELEKAAGSRKAKATADDAANKVTEEQPKQKDKLPERGPAVTEAERQAGFELLGRLAEPFDSCQCAELAELAEKAAPYYGQMCRDLADRLRQAEAEAAQLEGAKAA